MYVYVREHFRILCENFKNVFFFAPLLRRGSLGYTTTTLSDAAGISLALEI
jgi:hypothetical protein